MRFESRSQPGTKTSSSGALPHPIQSLNPTRTTRPAVFIALLVAISAFAGVLAYEIYHRITLSSLIPDRINGAAMWIQNHTLTPSLADEYFGRKVETHPRGLFKINTTIDTVVAHPIAGILNFSVRTNNVGLLSDHDYAFERDPAKPEYRVAILGDSFTGTTTATYQWVDTVEELLNSNTALQEKIGNKKITVYNFGWVGAGFNTFWFEFDRSARYFSTDLIVINYIDVDFERTGQGHLTDDSKMVEHAMEHLHKISAEQPNIVLSLMPTYNELMSGRPDDRRTKLLMQAEQRAKVEIMQNRLPTHLGKDEIEKWYSVPHDAHMSDRGGEVYARALAAWIAEKITSQPFDFTKMPTKHWNLDPNAPRLRKIKNSLSRIVDHPEVVKSTKQKIIDEEVNGKVFTANPHFFHVLKSGSNGLTVPYSLPMIGGFEPIHFGEGHDDVMFLYLSCVTRPVTLRNPQCYHFQHVFVK